MSLNQYVLKGYLEKKALDMKTFALTKLAPVAAGGLIGSAIGALAGDEEEDVSTRALKGLTYGMALPAGAVLGSELHQIAKPIGSLLGETLYGYNDRLKELKRDINKTQERYDDSKHAVENAEWIRDRHNAIASYTGDEKHKNLAEKMDQTKSHMEHIKTRNKIDLENKLSIHEDTQQTRDKLLGSFSTIGGAMGGAIGAYGAKKFMDYLWSDKEYSEKDIKRIIGQHQLERLYKTSQKKPLKVPKIEPEKAPTTGALEALLKETPTEGALDVIRHEKLNLGRTLGTGLKSENLGRILGTGLKPKKDLGQILGMGLAPKDISKILGSGLMQEDLSKVLEKGLTQADLGKILGMGFTSR